MNLFKPGPLLNKVLERGQAFVVLETGEVVGLCPGFDENVEVALGFIDTKEGRDDIENYLAAYPGPGDW